MKTLRIDVSDSIYEHIIFFLKSLPKNLIHISDEKGNQESNDKNTKQQVQELLKSTDIKAFTGIHNPVVWQKSMRDEWE
jgi:hypothetical protein